MSFPTDLYDGKGTAVPSTLPQFNPSGDPRVGHIKTSVQTLIDWLMLDTSLDYRCKEVAVTRLEEASMWAVKSIFAK